MPERTTSLPPWFEVDDRRYPQWSLATVTVPVLIAPAFDARIVPIASDVLARPHDRAASEQLDLECRDLAADLVVIADEDGHPNMLANVLRALVLRIAESGDVREADS